ncbi:MAG: alpha/beta fold hydrolase [Nocardioides sp.]
MVIDVPGWAAPEALTGPLRGFLRSRGYDSRGWGFGRNRGDVRGDVQRLAHYLDSHIDPDEPAALVGWSLGGVIVREVARRRPHLVRSVVTFGTPLVGGTAHTAVDRLRQATVREHLAANRLAGSEARDHRHPLQAPVTVILSRRDGVVDWRSCLDHHSPRAEHVEVGSSHLGMVLDPDVWSSVAWGLARDRHGA